MSNAYFRLDGGESTLVLMSTAQSMPRLLYWSNALDNSQNLDMLALACERCLPHGGLDVAEQVSWLPEAGRGFTDCPGLELRRGQCRLDTQFLMTQALRTPTGWQFELADAACQALLTLRLDVDAETGVFSAQVSLLNDGADALQVDSLISMALPVPAHFQTRMSLTGRWAHEFQPVLEPIAGTGGAWLQESRVGRTSHHAYPGLALMSHSGGGECWGAQLAWSGNHRLLLQPQRLGGVQLQLGELLLGGEVQLAPTERHVSPAVHFVRSAVGSNDLSQRWHRFIRSQLQRRSKPVRPVQFSTWEATYFDHDAQKMSKLVHLAAELGVERFVLDDGWFAGRHDDHSGLGDWQPCPLRYPDGLAPLANHCQSLGMQFGLWVEPESVNRASHLFKAHPEWVLGGATQWQPLGRHQYLLNLGLAQVRAHLFEQLDGLLRSAPISFLKWDMNRDVTHAGGADGRAGVRAHVMGVYQLIDSLRAAHPNLEIESCASGGARADLGMVSRCERIWVSDSNDPLVRQRSQRGYFQFLPPEMMGVHVGDTQSHATQRASSMALRTLNALFGHFGVEADLTQMSAEDKSFLRAAIAVYKAERDWLHQGAITCIDHPDPALSAVMALAQNRQRALVSVVALDVARDAIAAALRLPDLPGTAIYRVSLHPLWQPKSFYAKQVSTFHLGEPIELAAQILRSTGISLPPLLCGQGILIQLDALTIDAM